MDLAGEPETAADWDQRGYDLWAMDRHDEALGAFRQALALEPRRIAVWDHLFGALQEQGRYRLNHQVAEGAAGLMPQEPVFVFSLGNAKSHLGDFDGALACYQRAHELDPELDGKGKPVTLWRAISLARVGRHGEALALLAESQPAYSTWQEFQRALHQADTLLWLDRWDEGRDALDRLLAEFRPPAWTSRDLGVIGSLVLRTQNPQVWRRFIALWLDFFARHGRLTELGDALVRSLRYCAVDWVTDQTAQAWYAAWRDLAGDRAELALPLRLLAAGVAYRADRDPRALLDLPREERGLLEPWLINLYQDQPDQTDRDLDDLLQRVAARLDQDARQAQARAYWEAPAPPPDRIDLDAVLADYGAPPAPGPAWLLSGPWETLDRTAAAVLLRRLANQGADGARALARPGLRVLAVLRCHPGFSDQDLYQVQILDGPRPGALDLLAGTTDVRLLDGLAQTLLELVESGTIRLDTPAAQSDYTRFCFSVGRAEEGRFQVIDGLDDLPLAAAPPPEAQAAHPWGLERVDRDGRPVYAGTVLFGTNLFRVTLALHPWSGRVELLADAPIAEDLPIRREGFDGPIRYLAEAASTPAAVP
jgi:tetratricopeptide (TPR) repeat protein